MKFKIFSVAILAIFLSTSALIASSHTKKDIVDTAVSAGSFNTLVAAVQAADLVDTLKSEGPFTVFAPTDDAFAKLPAGTLEDLLKPENKDKLKAILTYHVVSGKYMAKDVVTMKMAETVNGQSFMITYGCRQCHGRQRQSSPNRHRMQQWCHPCHRHCHFA